MDQHRVHRPAAIIDRGSGGLRVYLADDHLAAQCDFLPEKTPASGEDAQKEQQFLAAENKMTECLQKLAKQQAGGSGSVVQKVVKNNAEFCGRDFIAVAQQSGLTKEQSQAWVMVSVYQALGCRYSNPMEADTLPPESRAITCSPPR
jgi:hypothetical protein